VTDATTPYRVDTITDSHGTYEERWMVPPPGEGVMFRVTAEAWVTQYDNGYHVPTRVRVINEWKAVEKRREL
jgi:hypothetical protein